MKSKLFKRGAVACAVCFGFLVVMAMFRTVAQQVKNRNSADYEINSLGLIEFRQEQAREILGRELSNGESAKYLFHDLSGVTNGYEASKGRDILTRAPLLELRQGLCAGFLVVEVFAVVAGCAMVMRPVKRSSTVGSG